MANNIENTVGLQHCYWKTNGKATAPQKGETYYLYEKDKNEFYVDETCVGGKTTNPQHTISNARWAFIYDFFFQKLVKAKQEDLSENLWGSLSGGTENISMYALGNKYKIGKSLLFNPKGYSYYYGFKQRIELFSKTPGAGFYFYVIPITTSHISYAYFGKSEDVKHYGENISLTIMFHGYNLDIKNKYKAKVYLLEETEAKGITETKDFENKNLWDNVIVKDLAKHESESNYNVYLRHNFNISIDWKKGENHKKNFTVAVEVYKVWDEPDVIYGTNAKEERVIFRNFADEPTTDLVEYNSELLGLKDVDDKKSISSRFLVSEELMDHYLTRIEQEKKNMIQYIGDIRYTKQEFDPCGYSKITIQDKEDKERQPFVIFDETKPAGEIDKTDHIFAIIAGDERKDITITLDGLQTKNQFCQALLLDDGQKHTEHKNVFQVDKIYSAYNNGKGYEVHEDKSHQEQQKNADIAISEEYKHDNDVIKTDKVSNPSAVQRWQDGVDCKIVSDKEITLKLRYLYNKTAFENIQSYINSRYTNEVLNSLWMFRYFFLNNTTPQVNFLPISTCRYPNQIAKLNIYPDIEWLLSLKLSSTIPDVYSHTNMSSGPTYDHHQDRAIEAEQNRRRLNKEVSFELIIKATTGSTERSIGIAYEDKIETLLKALIKVKEVLDNITGVTSARNGMSEGIANRLPGFLGKSPITFQLDYPVISIEGGWKYGFESSKNNIEIQGKLAVALTPLIKGTGKLDLIACAEFIPPAKPIIMAIRTATKAIGVDIWFNLFAFGQIDLSYTFLFGAIEGAEPLNIATTVGVGAELGVKASAEVPKLSFGSETTDNMNIGFEASAKGETSLIISGKQGSTTEGIYLEPSVGFGGMVVTVTAKASVWKMGVGFEDKPYELIKPEPDLLKDRFYIIKANNGKK